MQQQYITTVTTVIDTEGDAYRQSLHIADRDSDLAALARNGYSLSSTITIPGADRVTIIDTLTRPADA